MNEESPQNSSADALDHLLGLKDMSLGRRNVDNEGGIVEDASAADDTPPETPVDDGPPPGHPLAAPENPQAKPLVVDVPADEEEEIAPLAPEGQEQETPPADPEEGEKPESEEGKEATISTVERERDLFQKLLENEDPFESEGAEPATPPSTSPPTVTPPVAPAAKEGAAETPSQESTEESVQLEDPYEGLEPDDPEYIRMKRLEKLLEYNATKKAMTKVGKVVEEAYEQKDAAMALMRDTYEMYPWLREPGRPKAFERSIAHVQRANPGITDGRRLLDLTAKNMADFLKIDVKTGQPLGVETKTETKTEAPDESTAPPAELPNKQTRAGAKKKLTGEAALIADTMVGFRDGGV